MAAELVITSEAKQDISRAYGWYEGQRPGLGAGFLEAIESCIHSLQRNPEVHESVRGDYRRALVRRYPYAVVYRFKDDVVKVASVVHTSRDSTAWQSRLE